MTGASLGRSAVADASIAGGNVNQHVCSIRLNTNELDAAFLNQYFLSPYGQKQIDRFQVGGDRDSLTATHVRSFSIPCPPKIEEQVKIAAFLLSIDALIAAQHQKLDALTIHRKGLLQQLFPTADTMNE